MIARSKNIEMKQYPPNLKNYLIQRSNVIGICNPSWITDEVMDLLLQMLQISPSKRKTADEVRPDFCQITNSSCNTRTSTRCATMPQISLHSLPP